MKRLLIIWTFSLTVNCFAQTTDTKEQFINSVYLTLIDSSFTQYYLSIDRTLLYIDKYEKIEREFGKYISKSILQQIINKAHIDTLSENWNCAELSKSKCVDKDTVGLITNTTITFRVDSKWNARTKEKEKERQIQEQKKAWAKKPQQEKRVYYFSKPIFDNNNEYAIVSVGYVCGNLCGHGCTLLFKKINGKWTKLAETSCWIS